MEMVRDSHFKLAFDPEKPKGEDAAIVKQIFSDPIARALWCFIKRGHLTSQYFAPECLAIAEQIRKTPPKDTLALQAILRGARDPAINELWRDHRRHHPLSQSSQNFQMLLDCIHGKRKLTIEIKP